MNMTYARAKFRLTPKQKDKVERDWQQDQSQLYSRKMVTAKSASTLPPKRKDQPNRARRHRLNLGRRSVEENRRAR